MDFEAIAKGCPWCIVMRRSLYFGDGEKFECMASSDECNESNCAPLHWLRAMEGKDEKDG